MYCRRIYPLLLVLFSYLFQNCDDQKTGFKILSASKTGLTFNNQIIESDSFNVLAFEYIYNGGGVGVGDLNNDGLMDIFFAGNMVSSALYLNQGGLRFEDVTQAAGVTTTSWCTGVAVVDINHDGLLDIYVCTAQPHKDQPPVPNLLFINQGNNANNIPTFVEAAAKVGLADSSYATQAAFLDFDLDGDLDMYLLTNALEDFNRNTPVGQHHDGTGKSVDKLFRNEGTLPNGWPVFKDGSLEAGILSEGWGLGVVVNDVNQDGYPDVYAANDFLSNDHLYINNRDGTFTNQIAKALKHQEHNGMGMDIADINNDGLNDIVVMDMMPDDNLRQKTMFSSTGYDRFWLNRRMHYQDQYTRNVLQLNNGNGTYSDIGYLTGIYATDWSWSCLLADFDNDGYRDLFVTNGYRKDITDLDFVSYLHETSVFGTDEARKKSILQEIENMKGVKKSNFIFQNQGNLRFQDVTKAWGIHQPSYSNGAAYADFDNDGDLDIVVNNLNDKAFLYENIVIQNKTHTKPNTHFISIKLIGEAGNIQGLGSRIFIYYNDGSTLYAEHQLQRGYKSTVAPCEHFGLGAVPTGSIDSIRIWWQNGKTQLLQNTKVDQVITLYQISATSMAPRHNKTAATPWLEPTHVIRYKHEEEEFVDFQHGQPTLPQKHSQSGPALAVGDLNGDGLDDVIIGGSAGKARALYLQQKDFSFIRQPTTAKPQEDLGLLLFDADGDDDLDLYSVSGSSEFTTDLGLYQDLLYRNNGRGILTPDTTALPHITSSGGCVTACDFDQDGDLDLFVGGRITPQQYPVTPTSYLLQNNGQGNFKDVTAQLSPTLQSAGMVTAALWTDFDLDGWTDLMLVGEWMPITCYKNIAGRNFIAATIPFTEGWWNSLTGADFDLDGDVDYIAGNLGLNAIYKASPEEPVCLYAKDYDQNGSMDPILCRFIDGKEYPVHPRETLVDQLVSMRRVLRRYATYGEKTFAEIMTPTQLEDAIILKAYRFESSYIENTGHGTFKVHSLPMTAQLAPLYGIIAKDINDDGYPDVLGVGNSYASDPLTGFYDAGQGICLWGNGQGGFTPADRAISGFTVSGDAKALATLYIPHRILYLVTQNRDSLRVFQQTIPAHHQLINLKPYDQHAIISHPNGRKEYREFYWGTGYLSQSSRYLTINTKTDSLKTMAQHVISRKYTTPQP